MYKKYFGKKRQISFSSESEYYEVLGFLAKSDGSTKLVLEHNEKQGAWTREYRIHFYVTLRPFPESFKHTDGTGNIFSRVNCNEFVENILQNHHFELGSEQDIVLIRSAIPDAFLIDFGRGETL